MENSYYNYHIDEVPIIYIIVHISVYLSIGLCLSSIYLSRSILEDIRGEFLLQLENCHNDKELVTMDRIQDLELGKVGGLFSIPDLRVGNP